MLQAGGWPWRHSRRLLEHRELSAASRSKVQRLFQGWAACGAQPASFIIIAIPGRLQGAVSWAPEHRRCLAQLYSSSIMCAVTRCLGQPPAAALPGAVPRSSFPPCSLVWPSADRR